MIRDLGVCQLPLKLEVAVAVPAVSRADLNPKFLNRGGGGGQQLEVRPRDARH